MEDDLLQNRSNPMLFELVLGAIILSLIGLALFVSNNKVKQNEVATVPATASSLAVTTVNLTDQDLVAEAAISDMNVSEGDELDAADAEVTKLGESFDENSF